MSTQSNIRHRSRLRRDPSGHLRLRLQPRHLRILLLLYHIRYATAEILAILYEAGDGAGSKRLRNDLGNLYHAGFAERWYHSSQLPGLGSTQYVYAITSRGARAILPQARYAHES